MVCRVHTYIGSGSQAFEMHGSCLGVLATISAGFLQQMPDHTELGSRYYSIHWASNAHATHLAELHHANVLLERWFVLERLERREHFALDLQRLVALPPRCAIARHDSVVARANRAPMLSLLETSLRSGTWGGIALCPPRQRLLHVKRSSHSKTSLRWRCVLPVGLILRNSSRPFEAPVPHVPSLADHSVFAKSATCDACQIRCAHHV